MKVEEKSESRQRLLKSYEEMYFRVSMRQIVELRDAALEAGRAELAGPDSKELYEAVQREARAFNSCTEHRIRKTQG